MFRKIWYISANTFLPERIFEITQLCQPPNMTYRDARIAVGPYLGWMKNRQLTFRVITHQQNTLSLHTTALLPWRHSEMVKWGKLSVRDSGIGHWQAPRQCQSPWTICSCIIQMILHDHRFTALWRGSWIHMVTQCPHITHIVVEQNYYFNVTVV